MRTPMRPWRVLLTIVLASMLVVAARAAPKLAGGHLAGGGGQGSGGGRKLVGSILGSPAGKCSGGGRHLTGGFIAGAQVWREAAGTLGATSATGTTIISALSAVGNRAGGAQITFSLASPAATDVRVLSIAGRHVRTITVGRDCDAGLNTLAWSGLSDSGLPVPNGRYLIEVRARGPRGTRARALASVRVGG